MKITSTQQITNSPVGFQVKELVIVLTLAVTLPVLIHLIPFSGPVPIGARLLPLFYAPLIAALLYKPHISLLTSILAPGINFMLTGAPIPEMVLILSFELFVFSLFISWTRQGRLKWLAALFGYLAAKISSVLLISLFPGLLESGSAMSFGVNSIQNGIAGLVILTMINIAIVVNKKDVGNG